MTDGLSKRALNRATLARQYLLERAPTRAVDAIERLAGMQSQAPLAPYVGLWTRLRDLAPGELATLAEERQVVRLQLMRNTVHLVGARDALNWAALFAPLSAAEFNANFRAGTADADLPAVLAEAGRLLAERPRSRAELGRLLAERWPQSEPRALGYAVTLHLTLCQVPPRGVWGKGGAATWGGAGRLAGRAAQPRAGRVAGGRAGAALSGRVRARLISHQRRVPLPPGNGATGGTFLIDGWWQGSWQLRDRQLRIRPFVGLRPADRDALLAEAAGLCAFIAPATATDVVLDDR